MASKISSSYNCKSEIRMESHVTGEVTKIISHLDPVKIKQERPVGVGSTFQKISAPMMNQSPHEPQYMQLMSAELTLPFCARGCEKYYSEASMKFPHSGSNIFIIEGENLKKNPTSNSCDIYDTNIKPKHTMKSYKLNPEAKEFVPSKFLGRRTKTLSYDLHDKYNKVSANEFEYISTRKEIFFESYCDAFEGIKITLPICSLKSPKQTLFRDSVSFDHISGNFSVSSNSLADEKFKSNGFSKNSKMYDPCTCKYMPYVPKDNSFKFNNSSFSPPSNSQTFIDVRNLHPPDTQSRKLVKELDSEKENRSLYFDAVHFKSENISSNSSHTMPDRENNTVEYVPVKSQHDDGGDSSSKTPSIINENNGLESRNRDRTPFSEDYCSIKDETLDSENDNDKDTFASEKEIENSYVAKSSKCSGSIYKHDVIREEEERDKTCVDKNDDWFKSNDSREFNGEVNTEEKDIDECDDDGIVFVSNESYNEFYAKEEEEFDDETDLEEEEESDDETDLEEEEESDNETDAEEEESDNETDAEEEESDEEDDEESDDEADLEEEDESDNDSTVCFISYDTHESDDEIDIDSVDCCGVTDDDNWENDNDDDVNCDYNCDLFEVEFSDDEFTMPMGGLILDNIISQNSNSKTKDSTCDSVCNSDELDGFVCNISNIESEVVAEANKRWNETIDNNWCLSTPTKVQFSDDVEIYLADEWCRKGPWEVCARDRMRFQRRIEESESFLNPILSSEHRFKVLNRLQTSDKK